VLDAVGRASYLRCRRLLAHEGRYAATDLGPWGQNLVFVLWSALTRSRRFTFPFPRSNKAFVESMRERLEAGQFRAVIDRQYPLDSIVEAYRYVETKQKTGIVVLKISHRERRG
jgi:NADPH:quinone reductase-like Zn-dependent oxidoreductase